MHSKSRSGKLAPSNAQHDPGSEMTEAQSAAELDPPQRLLCGPGPTNVAPSVLAAMQKPMLGHLDPDLHEILLEVVAELRQVYRATGGLVLPLQATGSSGMEAGIVNLVEPGETVVVGVCGFFGRRIAEKARRAGAEVIVVEADWGEIVPTEEIVAALERHPETRLVALVQAETSTGVEQPIAELADALASSDALLMVDCVTSLGGIPVEFDRWGIDYAYSCTQKCLAAPPGMSPIAVSERALERFRSRRHPVPFCFDLGLLEELLGDPARDLPPHGADPPHLRPARGAAAGPRRGPRAALGPPRRGRRLPARRDRATRARAARRPRAPARAADRRPAPEVVDGKAVQTAMLREDGIEIGGGLGPQAPPMWRIGLMGENASIETADEVLAALDAALAEHPVTSLAG